MSNASLELGGDNWAAKDGNLLGYAVGDSSGKYVPREFTFTRGSNLAATRVAANGLIEKGRENLLLQSNNFGTTWTRSNVGVTSGQSGYDDSSDAWLLDISGGASSQRIEQSMSFGGIQTFSVYAKAGTLNWIRMRGSSNTYFDLANGVIGADGHIDSKIESIGNGWYRCSVVTETSTLARIYLATDNGNVTQSSGNIYIQDAQLEQGLVATDYIETGATTVKAGLLEDEPRIDYTGGTGSLLLEPSRTNLITHSEYFEGDWSNTRSSLNFGYTSPQGTDNAYKLISDNTASSSHILISDSFTISASTDYTGSIFVKGDEINWVALMLTDTSVSDKAQAWFNLSNGTKGSTEEGGSATISDYGIEDYGNGWYRIYIVADLGGDTTAVQRLYLAEGNEDSSFDGNGTDGVYLFGAQVEEGSYPTSYIPNHSGGNVTRAADSMNSPNSVVGATDNYTIFFDISNDKANTASGGNSQWLKGRNSSDFNIWTLRKNDVSDQKYHSLYFNEDSDYVFTNQTINKACFVFTSSEIKVFLDGSLNTTYSVTNSPLGLDDFLITYGSSDRTNIVLSQFLLFPTALSDAQCSALTVEGLKEEILTSYIAAVDTLEDGAEARLDTYLQNLEELIV